MGLAPLTSDEELEGLAVCHAELHGKGLDHGDDFGVSFEKRRHLFGSLKGLFTEVVADHSILNTLKFLLFVRLIFQWFFKFNLRWIHINRIQFHWNCLTREYDPVDRAHVCLSFVR